MQVPEDFEGPDTLEDDLLDDAVTPHCEVKGDHPFNSVAAYAVRDSSSPVSEVAMLCERHGNYALATLTEIEKQVLSFERL